MIVKKESFMCAGGENVTGKEIINVVQVLSEVSAPQFAHGSVPDSHRPCSRFV